MKNLRGALLCIFIFPLWLFSEWSSDPSENTRLSDLSGDQELPKIAVCTNGDIYISWFSNESGNYNVRLQRLDADGNEIWEHNGLLVSSHPSMSWLTDYDLAVDNENCAILTFQDERTGATNIYAYRISSEGEFLWGEDGIALSNNSDFEPSPKVLVTERGNFVFAWQRCPEDGNDVIVLQKVSPSGELLWEDGIVLQSDSGEDYTCPQLVPAEGDCFILVWFKEAGVSWNPNRYLYAQKIDSLGNRIWEQDIPIYTGGDIPIYVEPVAISDGAGGVYIAWHCGTTVLTARVQHIDSDGNLLMPENGVEISTQSGHHHIAPSIVYSPTVGDVITFWIEADFNQTQWGIYGQRLSPEGIRQWSDTGICFLPLSYQAVASVTAKPCDSAVAVIFNYFDFGNAVDSRIASMLIDQNGNLVWDGQFVDLSNVQSEKTGLEVSEFFSAQWVAVWSDARYGNNDIYAQNIRITGELGTSEITEGNKKTSLTLMLRVSPTLFRPDAGKEIVHVVFKLVSKGHACINIYDATGKKVRNLLDNYTPEGIHTIAWDGRDESGRMLHPGVYFMTLKFNRKHTSSTKFLVIR